MQKDAEKTVVVTGGTKGIGRAIATEFALAGYRTAILGRKPEEGEAAAAEIRKKTGSYVRFFDCDLSDSEDIKRAVSDLLDVFPKIDCLVNNAGIYPAVPFLEMKADQFDQVFSVNVRGTFLMTQEVAGRAMVPNKKGKIICISSVDGWKPSAGITAYAASKAAVNSMVKSFAIELAPYGITANGIAPGWVGTEPVRKAGRWKSQIGGVLEGRMAEPSEIGRAAVALCSGDFAYMDGEIINLSGGLILNG